MEEIMVWGEDRKGRKPTWEIKNGDQKVEVQDSEHKQAQERQQSLYMYLMLLLCGCAAIPGGIKN